MLHKIVRIKIFQNISTIINMFYGAKFCGDISGWVNYENTNFLHCFQFSKNFENKYLEKNTKMESMSSKVKEWLNNNLENIKRINTKDELILDYFEFN